MSDDTNSLSNLKLSPNGSLIHALESFLEAYKAQETEHNIPLSIFSNKELGILELVVKHLKEHEKLSFHEIAELLKRDDRTIWTTYSQACKKHEHSLFAKEGAVIPISLFSNRHLGPLEALVIYLKDNAQLSFCQISTMLHRDYRTIWLSYRNGKKKVSNG